ncbi:MAG: hypothetical protein CVT68_01335 [Actinobacteria bacterium HGW-Actinobacteria-8]|nr:MAG: hypothetical protein CVT68_01335 [Actinobacteria bacterium HGW-Actinobacteria-8]
MMLRTLYLKSIRDHWLGAAIAVVSLFLVAWMGLWAYVGGGDAVAQYMLSLPDAYSSLLGVPGDSGTAGLMFANLFNFLGPFVLCGIAVSMGANAFAGEERDGTMNLLATVPRSRGRLLASKTLAAATMVVAASVVSVVLYQLAITMTGSDAGSLHLVSASVHLGAVTLVYGAIALAIGGLTGNRGQASGITTGLLVVSFLASGLLPLIDGVGGLAQIFPWYYIGGSQPLINGTDWLQIFVLVAVVVGLVAVAWWGVNHRDLAFGGTSSRLLDRLRSDPRFARGSSLLAGSGSTRGIVSKAVSDSQAVLTIATGGLFVLLVAIGPMFLAIKSSLGGLIEAMPEALLSMVGSADFTTASGWYFGEGLTITAPIAVAVVAIGAGAALAGEERRRTVDVLLGTPISRARLARSKAVAMASASAVVGAGTAAGMALGNLVANLGLNYGYIAVAGVLTAALGTVLGGAAFFAGALSGRSSIATGVGTGVAVIGWAINAFIPVDPDLADWARVSPFYYYATPNPLEAGVTPPHLAVLLAVSAALVAGGVWAYGRRDLKS